MDDRRRPSPAALLGIVGLLLVAAGVYALTQLGSERGNGIAVEDAYPLVAAPLVIGIAALVGWARDWRLARAAGDASEARGRAESEAEAAREKASEAEGKATEARTEARRERERLTRVERARRSEREWNRELRGQIFQLHRERGLFGATNDVRELVLRVAITLLGAEKGLLLSRQDADGDGELDLVCAEGFDNDPSDSVLAQRFAGEVIAADTTIREDGGVVDSEQATPADREIHNLVAIPIYMQDRFSGAVVCANRDGGFEDLDDDVLLALGDHAGAVLDNGRLHGDLREAYVATVRMLAEALQAKDPYLRGHCEEVSGYVSAVADRLGIEPQRREELVFGSLLHDVGKIGISEGILMKPGALTPEERTVVELHPRIGSRLVEQVPALRPIAPAILHHHERYDGAGYPAGLEGDDIPLDARIICVADSFSAMTAERPYRAGMPVEDACAELERCAGTQFDPEVVRVFVEQVRADPPTDESDALAIALADPEVERRRDGDEPILGRGALAVTDNLTFLYTHRYFHEAAEREAGRCMTGAPPFAVVVAELVDIAQVNQLEGYAAGDAAIQDVARSVQRAASREGGTACRYSGRRVGVILPSTTQESAERIAAEIAAELGSGPRVAVGGAAWRQGDSGFDAIARARLALSPIAIPPPSDGAARDGSSVTGAGGSAPVRG